MKQLIIISFLSICGLSNAQSLDERIKEIRAEYAKVNSEKQKVTTVEMNGESTEGGELKVYKDLGGNLRKLKAFYYGETGKIEQEYYVKDGKLFFAFIVRYNYNRPLYWDEKTTKEMGDDEVFDLEKTTTQEFRYYFSPSEKLIRYIDDKKKTFHDFPEKEELQKKVVGDFKELIE